jgi:transposase InsO family protein
VRIVGRHRHVDPVGWADDEPDVAPGELEHLREGLVPPRVVRRPDDLHGAVCRLQPALEGELDVGVLMRRPALGHHGQRQRIHSKVLLDLVHQRRPARPSRLKLPQEPVQQHTPKPRRAAKLLLVETLHAWPPVLRRAFAARRSTIAEADYAVCTPSSRYGSPEEILTDNGKQFTDRFGKGGEVLFDKICRKNGIAHRLTAPASPTTTGKVERFHLTLRRELLDDADPFPSLLAAQAAIDDWVRDYNAERPHQSLDRAAPVTPPQRFTAVPQAQRELLPLWLPPAVMPVADPEPAPSDSDTGQPAPAGWDVIALITAQDRRIRDEDYQRFIQGMEGDHR